MGDMTKNFSRNEFACKCGCGFDTIAIDTVLLLQEICDHFADKTGVSKVVCSVNSGCRCLNYNAEVGGTRRSQHLKGTAADIKIKYIDPEEVYEYVCRMYPDSYGFGDYDTFTHIDTRPNGPARW